MAANIASGIQYVGTEAAPIALGAAASATDVWTWTHNQGRKAIMIEVLDAVSRQPIAPGDQVAGVLLVGKAVIATQTTANIITLTNQSTIAQDCILRVTWSDVSAAVAGPLAALEASATAIGGLRELS